MRRKLEHIAEEPVFRSGGIIVTPMPTEVYEGGISQLARWERSARLSVVRERIREISEEIFELSCQLQKHFEAEDVKQALVLVAELKTLKAYEERLTEKASL